jgi:hypothetical protein
MQIRDIIPSPVLAFVSWIGSTALVTAVFWALFGSCVLGGGCIDTPGPDPDPQTRLLASWDPLACGDPHRVVVELEDEGGAKLSSSVPCTLGMMTLDVRHWGVYRGKVYAWALAEGASSPVIRSVVPVRLEIDMPIIEWIIETPR